MGIRYKKMTVNKAGGNSGKGALSWKISVPNKWVADMKIERDDRDVEMSYDPIRRIITIKKLNNR